MNISNEKKKGTVMTNGVTDEPVFPSWIEDGYKRIRSMLPSDLGEKFDECHAEYRSLSQTLNDFQITETIYEIPSLSIDTIDQYFDAENSALNFLCMSWIGYFYYQHIYRIKGYLDGLNYSMDIGNWLTVYTCLRCLLEEAAHFDYFISKMGKGVDQMDQLYRKNGITLKKNILPSEKWQKDLMDRQQNIISLAAKSIQGSKFDWKSYVEKLSSKTGFKHENYPDIGIRDSIKGINILTCIDDSSNRNNNMLSDHYSILSEFCHPNFGSNALVIRRKRKLHQDFGIIEFSPRTKDYMAASRFFEISCNPIISVFSLERTNICKGRVLYILFRRLAEARPSILNDIIKSIENQQG